jgi:hypothetical protein
MRPSLLRVEQLLPCVLALLAGCASIGPKTIPRDRFDYSASISESWKRQTLLNIVKLRYVDPPIFVDVGQIVAGYSLETLLTGSGSLPEKDNFGGRTLNLGASARYTDRPTITYTPLTGNKFIKGLMTPLPPDAIFFAIQSGWPADGVLFAGVASINGLKNQSSTIAGITPPDPEFLRAIQLLREIQLSGAVNLRIKQDAQKQQSSVITLRSTDISEKTLADTRELRKLLKLDPDASEFRLVFGATAADNKEIAVLPRSLLHILNTMAVQVDVPPEDVAAGRTTPGLPAGEEGDRLRLTRVYCSKKPSPDAFVAVFYRNHWFWIDDRDLRAKRAFAFMMFMFTMADTGEKEPLPLITIPAQ